MTVVAPLPTNSISSLLLSLPVRRSLVVLPGILVVYVVPEAPPAAPLATDCTNAVVASCVLFVLEPAVGAVGVPVKAALLNIVALDSFATLLNPTIDLLIPDTVPVNVGLARFAFKLSAVC